MGSPPSCSVVDPEMTIARESFPDPALLWTGDPTAPACIETLERKISLKNKARKNLPWGDDSGWQALAEADRLEALKAFDDGDSNVKGRHAMANRFALSAMGGTVSETLVNGFGLVSH